MDMERDKPPALPISIVTPAAYMAHDSKLQIHTWGKMAQVWNL